MYALWKDLGFGDGSHTLTRLVMIGLGVCVCVCLFRGGCNRGSDQRGEGAEEARSNTSDRWHVGIDGQFTNVWLTARPRHSSVAASPTVSVYWLSLAHYTIQYYYYNYNRLSGTTRVSRYQKGKTNLDLLEQEMVSGGGICWAICKSVPHPDR